MPLFIQYIIFVFAIFGFIGVVGYLDYNSTESALKRGTGVEANGIMATAINWLKSRGWSWLWLKIVMAVLAVSGIVISVFNGNISVKIADMVLIVISFLYYVFVVAHNYWIAGAD